MARQRPGLSNRVHPVVSYEDDVHAWMYFDQVDGVLRYEAFVVGYDERGEPSTLDFVVEEGLFDLACFPAIAALLARSLQRPDGPGSRGDGGAGEAGEGAETPLSRLGLTPDDWNPGTVRSGSHTPWDLTTWQWQSLHRFCEEQEQRLKQEHRLRWTRRLRALGYDVIRSL